MLDLSVVIVAKDEERTIGTVLRSVKPLAKEIILVDSGSSDRTVEIARSFGANCYFEDWRGYSEQKNFAISLAKCTWILSIDADEVLSEALVKEIEELFEHRIVESYDAFLIPRILYIGDTAITHGGFYPDAQLRLFRNGKGKFNRRQVHESIKLEESERDKIGRLKNPMLHYAYTDLTAFAEAMDKYAQLSAKEFLNYPDAGWRASRANEWFHPWWTFFYRYFLRGGFLDGTIGLKANWIYQNYVKQKIVYLREAIENRLEKTIS